MCDFESQILALFDSLSLIQNSKFNNILWVSQANIFLILYPLFENSTTRIAIVSILQVVIPMLRKIQDTIVICMEPRLILMIKTPESKYNGQFKHFQIPKISKDISSFSLLLFVSLHQPATKNQMRDTKFLQPHCFNWIVCSTKLSRLPTKSQLVNMASC